MISHLVVFGSLFGFTAIIALSRRYRSCPGFHGFVRVAILFSTRRSFSAGASGCKQWDGRLNSSVLPIFAVCVAALRGKNIESVSKYRIVSGGVCKNPMFVMWVA